MPTLFCLTRARVMRTHIEQAAIYEDSSTAGPDRKRCRHDGRYTEESQDVATGALALFICLHSHAAFNRGSGRLLTQSDSC